MARRSRRALRLGLAAFALLLAAAAIVVGLHSMQGAAEPSPAGDAATSGSFMEETDATDAEGFPVVDWDYWRSVNPDVIGWVTVPGTKVNQPVVQANADDPQYYLHHDVYRKANVYGVPYLDESCAATGLLHSPNAVVFGHHMSDGTVFAGLSPFSTDEAYARQHSRILIQTPTEKRVLECRFARIVDGASASKRTGFLDATDHAAWYATELAASSTVLDAVSQPSEVVCLVTCSYNVFENERTLVYAS